MQNINYLLMNFFILEIQVMMKQMKIHIVQKLHILAGKKAGVNLDSNTFAGNLISPDDIYSSSFDRYASITINLFCWSKTWTWQTYSATSKQLIIKAL